jgi:hypothetical protein
MYRYNNMIVAGIFTQQEFANWLKNGKPDTGYIFIRKLDNMEFGNVIYLGLDVSEKNYGLASKPREDKPEYYYEIKVEYLVDDNNI